MTYKGEKIDVPTLVMVEEYISRKGLSCDPKEVYSYWKDKEWKNQKKKEISSVEIAIDSFNQIVVNRVMKSKAKQLGYTKLGKKEKKREKRAIRKELLAGNRVIDDFIKEPLKETRKEKSEKYVSYSEQLKDKRWLAFRKFIFAVRGKKCELCGSTKILQVHHPKYKYGKKAWEYNCNEVVVLCKKCHEREHNIR